MPVRLRRCGSGLGHADTRLGRHGHCVRLMPPTYIKPFNIKRQNNNLVDVEAIVKQIAFLRGLEHAWIQWIRAGMIANDLR
jgi:hypothetical protein